MRHTTSPAQSRRRGATGNAPVRPRGAHYGTPQANTRPFRRHSRNVTAHSKEITDAGSRFFCKSFLENTSRPIFWQSRRSLAHIVALCAKSFITIPSGARQIRRRLPVDGRFLQAGLFLVAHLPIAHRRTRLMMKDLLHAPVRAQASTHPFLQKAVAQAGKPTSYEADPTARRS